MLELNRVHHGDNLALLRQMPDNCIDAVVTDPPYGLSFMGKRWDYDVPSVEQWAEVLRVLKPGGHLLSFAGTRTQHRMAVNIEDAGFEIRDLVMWVYGSGYPKSLNVSKAIDKRTDEEIAAGVEMCDAAKHWQGFGTALKPALEPITLARKPLDGTVAENVQRWGTGGLDIDGCRVGTETRPNIEADRGRITGNSWQGGIDGSLCGSKANGTTSLGRFPANLIHDGSDEVVGLFPVTASGNLNAGHKRGSGHTCYEGGGGVVQRDYGVDSGSAARFFYVPKPSSGERDEGCEGLEEVFTMRYGEKAQGPLPQQTPSKPVAQRNHHPTVKPVELMEYLVRLISREGQIVLDPWGGSGTTAVACKILKRQFILMEREAEYVKIAEARIGAKRQMKLL